jgi:alcohol dehydrogenase
VQADWPDGTLAEYALLPASSVVLADGFEDVEPTQLAAVSRFVLPYGGLVRGRLAAGETLVVNGAIGAYGSAAVLVALAMGAAHVVAAGRNAGKLHTLARLTGKTVVPVTLSGDRQKDAAALRDAATQIQERRSSYACSSAVLPRLRRYQRAGSVHSLL